MTGVLAHPASVPFGDLVFQNLEDSGRIAIRSQRIGPNIADLTARRSAKCSPRPTSRSAALAGQVSAADLATALYVANYAFQTGCCPAQPS